jgi:hypothetical protein
MVQRHQRQAVWSAENPDGLEHCCGYSELVARA